MINPLEKENLLFVFTGFALAVIITVLVICNEPHEKVEYVNRITITATELGELYSANERGANKMYLNQSLEVSGVINDIEKNQDGGTMLILQSNDPFTGIQCTMRDKRVMIKKGQYVQVKGYCSGNDIAGVTLTDCVLK